jgi:hypothetical protein
MDSKLPPAESDKTTKSLIALILGSMFVVISLSKGVADATGALVFTALVVAVGKLVGSSDTFSIFGDGVPQSAHARPVSAASNQARKGGTGSSNSNVASETRSDSSASPGEESNPAGSDTTTGVASEVPPEVVHAEPPMYVNPQLERYCEGYTNGDKDESTLLMFGEHARSQMGDFSRFLNSEGVDLSVIDVAEVEKIDSVAKQCMETPGDERVVFVTGIERFAEKTYEQMSDAEQKAYDGLQKALIGWGDYLLIIGVAETGMVADTTTYLFDSYFAHEPASFD